MARNPANGAAPLRGRRAITAGRRAAGWLACAACVAASASGCTFTMSNTSAATRPSASPATAASAKASSSAKASPDPGCTRAMSAISTYGPTVLQDAVTAKETLDKIEIDVIVFVLDAAADAAHDPAARQSISNLANAYSRFREAWIGVVVPPLESILGDTSRLDSVCRSL